jgi:hypothetical protein
MTGNLRDLTLNRDGTQNVTVTVNSDFRETFDKLKDVPISIEIKKAVKHRTKSANDFMWAMCTDIGNAMTPPLPKEAVYRAAIRDVGEYDRLMIRMEAVERFKSVWGSRGVGWFSEVGDLTPKPGYLMVFAYYGSSTYSTQAMNRLLEYLKQDMREMGLPLPMNKEEEERALKAWASS